MHLSLSNTARTARYASPRFNISRAEWERMISPGRGLTWIAYAYGQVRVVALCHLLATDLPGVHELALLVTDDWQGQGLGTALLHHALATAPPECHAITAMFSAANRRLLRIAARAGVALPPASGPYITLTLPRSRWPIPPSAP